MASHGMRQDTPTPEDVVARARELVPFLRKQAPAHREARRVTPDTIKVLKEAGLFRVLQPRRYGGYEMNPSVFAKVQIALANGDPSTGFIYGVLSVHSFHLGFYDEQAALDVWEKDPDVLIASPYAPFGRAVEVPGGYRLTGRWPFSSGCDNCEWNLLGGVIDTPEEAGAPLMTRMKSFLVPRSDANVIDTWNVIGLQGTGSKDIQVEDIFVPHHRVQKFPIVNPADHPGIKVNPGPIFNFPFMPLFLRAVSSASIGALEGMIDVFCAYTSGRRGVMNDEVAKDPVVQFALSQAKAGVEDLKAILFSNFAEAEDAIARGEKLEADRLKLFMVQSANAPHRAQELALGLMRAAGAHGIRVDRDLAHFYADILVIGQHSSNNPRKHGVELGNAMLQGA